MKSTTEIGHAILAPPFKQKKKKKKKNKKREIQINQVCPPTYQAKISNVWFTDSNKFSKKSHTLRHHLFFSIKMHHLNIAIRIESITATSDCEEKNPLYVNWEKGGGRRFGRARRRRRGILKGLGVRVPLLAVLCTDYI